MAETMQAPETTTPPLATCPYCKGKLLLSTAGDYRGKPVHPTCELYARLADAEAMIEKLAHTVRNLQANVDFSER